MIVESMKAYGGLVGSDFGERLMCSGVDGAFVFQGDQNGIMAQLRQGYAPYLMGIHCFAHRTKLAVKTLSKLSIVEKLEDLCQAMYAYFSKSPKRHLEFVELAEMVETKGNRTLRNVKTRWISMLAPLKLIMQEYKTLIVKMSSDLSDRDYPALAWKNLLLLCDIQTFLLLACLIPLLNTANDLVKMAQSKDVYVCDMVSTVKFAQFELMMLYCD
ncbi:unnamed protein product [Calypogeia fissa]